jgi:molecular chaperone DnaJ
MAATRDLYDILGVSRTATQDEVRKAYLKLAHKYHPDKTGGDKAAEEKLKEVNGAYDVLKNPEKRAQYDRFGSTESMGGGGFGGGAGGEAPFEDFFDMLFGGGGGRRRGGPQPGNDLELRLRITLEEAAFGAKKEVRFPRMESCGECKGSGAAPGSQATTCSQCNGQGQVRVAHGVFSVTRTCPQCRGAGKMVSNPCRKCSGKGQVKNTRELSVDIPKGIDTGSRLRVTGEGEAGAGGGPRGDLYIHIEVEPHAFFKRDGTTLLCEVPVSIVQAALGAAVQVPTLEGEQELKVPAGVQTGARLTLKGKGLPDLRGYRQGDLVVQVLVETPTNLTKRQKELLKEFEGESDGNTYPLYRRFLNTLKNLRDRD